MQGRRQASITWEFLIRIFHRVQLFLFLCVTFAMLHILVAQECVGYFVEIIVRVSGTLSIF